MKEITVKDLSIGDKLLHKDTGMIVFVRYIYTNIIHTVAKSQQTKGYAALFNGKVNCFSRIPCTRENTKVGDIIWTSAPCMIRVEKVYGDGITSGNYFHLMNECFKPLKKELTEYLEKQKFKQEYPKSIEEAFQPKGHVFYCALSYIDKNGTITKPTTKAQRKALFEKGYKLGYDAAIKKAESVISSIATVNYCHQCGAKLK